jgi:plasmid stabilization system protein ParE
MPRAQHDLQGIVRYIARHDPQIARRLGNQLIERTLLLSDHPEMGRVVPEMDNVTIRETIRYSYRIVYRVTHRERVVHVLRFWHAARGTPDL